MEKKEFKAKVIMETQLDSEGVPSAEGVVKETTQGRQAETQNHHPRR